MRDLAALRMTCENFVDTVIDDLVNHVVQTRPVVGVADVHAGTFANRVEPFQHLDAVRAVIVRLGHFFQRLSGHFLLFSREGNKTLFIPQNPLKHRMKSILCGLKKRIVFIVLRVTVCPSPTTYSETAILPS